MASIRHPKSDSRAKATRKVRDQILETAFAQVDGAGLEGLSIRGIATEIGLTPMAIYRHFENRDSIIAALTRDGVARLEERLMRVPDLMPKERLRAMLHAYLSFALEEPTSYYIVFHSHRPSDAPFLDEQKSNTSTVFELLRQPVADAISAGALAKRNSVEVTLTLWAQAHGLVALYVAGRFGGGETIFRRFYETSLELVLLGLR